MQNVILKNKPIILKNKDFQTIQIKVLFPFKNTINNLANMQLLPSLIGYKNKKYPTENDFSIAKKKLFILGCNVFFNVIGEDAFYSFNFSIPKKELLEKNYLEEQFIFFNNYLYNPLVSNNEFYEQDLEREIKNLRLGMDNALKNINPYQRIRIKELIDDVGIMKQDIIYHQELIDLVNSKNIYEHYLETIYNNQPVIYVMGDVDTNEFTELCNKYLFRKKFHTKTISVNLYNYLIPRETVQEINEKSNFKDSSISFVYKIKDFNDDEYVILNLLRDLLTSLSSRLLDIKLRDENELIYSSRVVANSHFGYLEITAFIQKENLEIVKDKIKELISDFKNTELIAPLLDNIKDRKRINLLRKLDSKYQIFEDFILHDLSVDDTAEEYYEKVLKITEKDISNFVDKLVLDTIYFLEEEEHE